jgi:hypothetical protein
VKRAVRPARVGPTCLAILAGLSVVAARPAPAAAQEYALASTAGDSVRFELAELRVMLEEARILYDDLVEDPRVLYVLGFGPPPPADAPDAAYPWNAVRPTSDSTVNVVTPGSLREADRAYYNYAVMRMREVRNEDPDDPCDELVVREEAVLSSFVDGWILTRTLFGGPAFAPLDELAFARAAGHLRALLAARGDASVGACAAAWADDHPEAIEAYEAWRTDAFPGLVPPAAADADTTAADAPEGPAEDRP